jgi:membrane peptidoglycan carboxypeptidase
MKSNPLTQIKSKITQVVKSLVTSQQGTKLAQTLKLKAQVPRLEVYKSGQKKPEVFNLVGDRYVLGRNSGKCDIVIQTPLVSQIHAELTRTKNTFAIADQDSTNGIYRRRQRLKSTTLRHKMKITLGPPELEAAVVLRYLSPRPWYLQAIQYAGFATAGLTGLLVLAIALEWQNFSVKPLPISEQGPVQVLADDNQTSIAPAETQSHTEANKLAEFGTLLPNAVIASEDSAYYWHFGVNPLGILRAVITNVKSRELLQGGSTITQQLARLLLRSYVGTNDSAGRKWREAVAAIKLSANYSKDELLTVYLNRVYLGNGVYGFQDAAKLYFNKSLSELDLSEAATLAGILPAPNVINPFKNKKLALEYRDRILNRMSELGMVKSEEAERARRSILKLNLDAESKIQGTIAPYYYGYVFDELEGLLGSNFAREGNLVVETSLNIRMQQESDRALKTAVARDGRNFNFSQGAIVTIDANNGAILAMTGGVDFQKSQFNRASQAYRQPGSTFKLFSYLAAIDRGISPRETFSCNAIAGVAGCHNGGSGNIDMYRGFALSENAVAIRVAEAVGFDNVIKSARQLGVKSKLEGSTNLVLGGYEVNMLEMVGAYGAIANQGKYNSPHGIQKIYDSLDCQNRKNYKTCRVIFDANQDLKPRQAINSDVADIMVDLMRGVVTYGTGRSAAIPQAEVAGKTGTTDSGRDLWFIGFIPSSRLLTAVWLGNDEGVTAGGSGLAAEVWGKYMSKAIR